MSSPIPLHVNIEEEFPHLSQAPIKEAVIEIRGRASLSWEEEEVLVRLRELLPEYPKHQSGRASQIQLDTKQEPKVMMQDLGWLGLMFTTEDEKHIAKFQIDLFSFSWLQPYGDWKQFTQEALRLWKIHYHTAKPLEVQRLGLRFINRIPISEQSVNLEDYFKVFPQDLQELSFPLTGFLHHNTYAVPGYPYAVNVIKTGQPAGLANMNESALILDIDVFTQNAFETSDDLIVKYLEEMHWLKNKIFFGIITDNLLNRLK